MKLNLAVAALVAGLFAAPAQAAVNLVTNGSFENGSNPGGFTTVNAGGTNITDWTVNSGSVDYIGTYWQASDGVRSIDMHGNALGTISQVVSGFTIGGAYRLTFDIAGNDDGAPTIKWLDVAVGPASGSYSFDVTGHSNAAMGWSQRSLMFVATGTSQTLTFSSPPPGTAFGAALDNVSISAVPEPATWAMMLIGFAGLGYAARRRAAMAA